MSTIHSTAIVSPDAVIGEGSSVGPYSIIGPHVVLGKNNRIGSHVVIEGRTHLGEGNNIFQFASVGSVPQDLKYRGEESILEIGNNNIIREYATLQPGTKGGGMVTRIGHSNLFMANTHVGHDCIVGNNNVLANSVALSGHVTVGNGVILGGLSGVHQFVSLGDLCLLAAGAMVSKDIPPFCIAQGDRAALVGLNIIGLKRKGFGSEDIRKLRALYREVISPGEEITRPLTERVEMAQKSYTNFEAGKRFLDFISNSKRGIAAARRDQEESSFEE